MATNGGCDPTWKGSDAACSIVTSPNCFINGEREQPIAPGIRRSGRIVGDPYRGQRGRFGEEHSTSGASSDPNAATACFAFAVCVLGHGACIPAHAHTFGLHPDSRRLVD
jgi:hypothetical protein